MNTRVLVTVAAVVLVLVLGVGLLYAVRSQAPLVAAVTSATPAPSTGVASATAITTPAPTASATASATVAPVASASPAAPLAEIHQGPIQLLTSKVGWVGSAAGLEKTSDGGATWRVVNASETFGALRFVDEQHGWAIVLATPLGKAAHAGCPAQGICQIVGTTQDGGATWTDRVVIPPGPTRGPLVIQAIDASLAWILAPTARCDGNGCAVELRKTTDGGATWTIQRTGSMEALRMATAQRGWLSNSRVPANGSDVFTTSDGGATWTKVFTAVTNVVGLDAASGADVWILSRDGATCTSSNCATYELLTSADTGASWTSLGNPKSQACATGHIAGPLFASRSRGWAGLTLGAGGANGTGGIMRTDDGGTSWTCATEPTNVGALSAADPENVWARSDRRENVTSALFTSTDGGKTWRQLR